MSNALAISAVTATLTTLLLGVQADSELTDTEVTTRPPDVAREGISSNQLNLFLYQTALDGALRNMDPPGRVKPGETAQPALPLNLFYLLTAYGRGDGDVLAHRLLGRAMAILHDHPVLGADEIRPSVADNDLYEQMERVRITPQPLTLDELSKLWTSFGAKYRISAAYEASVVLIDSERPVKAPLPVLTRGPADQGVTSQPDLTPPFPALAAAVPATGQPAARLGDAVLLEGFHLDGDVVVTFVGPGFPAPVVLAAMPNSDPSALSVPIPGDAPAEKAWASGLLRVSASVTAGGRTRVTNEVALPVAPKVTAGLPATVARDPHGAATIALSCVPEVGPGQDASLIVGDRTVPSQTRQAQTGDLTFVLADAEPGEHLVRLRVDGVDSLLVDRAKVPPAFDQTQKVTVT